ncbi:MAG: SurA N-terminal domain-containing protein [Nitrospirota bacterium]
MLKMMRKHAKFFYILFFIVILSFIFWGVGSVDKSTAVAVVKIEKEQITLEDFWTAYDRARNFYREVYKDKFNDELEKQLNIKQLVLDALINERVLFITAKKAGITVTDEELEDAIINDPAFLRDGRFNKDIYLRILDLNRMTPEFFESMKRKEITALKMRRLVGESVALTDIDLKKPSGGEQPKGDVVQAMLLEMRDKALKSYIEGIKSKMKIQVNQQLIS